MPERVPFGAGVKAKRPLPVVPAACEGEAFASWLARIAALYGVGLPALLAHLGIARRSAIAAGSTGRRSRTANSSFSRRTCAARWARSRS
jgi:hypothetical protein